MKKNNTTISTETQQQALKVAKSTQRPGQTKEQTRLIAQGIEKGIAEYKKRQKQLAREADKAKKKSTKQKQTLAPESTQSEQTLSTPNKSNAYLPWTLLVISWLGFIGFVMYGS
jgi:hypothetical protein